MNRLSLRISGIVLMALVSAPVLADECEPVRAFVQLGDSANRCVVAVQTNSTVGRDTMTNYRYCSEVRMIRRAVEQGVEKMAPDQINRCAKSDEKAYTDAATALQKMYQLELRLKP